MKIKRYLYKVFKRIKSIIHTVHNIIPQMLRTITGQTAIRTSYIQQLFKNILLNYVISNYKHFVFHNH